jgi:hypothetical protein
MEIIRFCGMCVCGKSSVKSIRKPAQAILRISIFHSIEARLGRHSFIFSTHTHVRNAQRSSQPTNHVTKAAAHNNAAKRKSGVRKQKESRAGGQKHRLLKINDTFNRKSSAELISLVKIKKKK